MAKDKEYATCTQCGEEQDTYSEIVYSQGNRVCLTCKKENEPSDKKAFDRDMGRYA